MRGGNMAFVRKQADGTWSDSDADGTSRMSKFFAPMPGKYVDPATGQMVTSPAATEAVCVPSGKRAHKPRK